jgi:hypothetical protein
MRTRRFVLSIAMVLAFAGSGFSQKLEVFGGYSYQRTGDEGLNGFNAAVTGSVASWAGITGEVSRHSWGTSMIDPFSNTLVNFDANILAFRFGPKFVSHVNDNASFFVQPLVGGYRMGVDAGLPGMNVNASATGFTTAAGAGFDLRVGPKVAIRPAQVDWIYFGNTDVSGTSVGNSNGFRYSGGVVFKF